MKKSALIIGLLICFGTVLKAQQMKIGYANLEAILSVMPESQTMAQQLRSFQQKLGQSLKTKEDYLRLKYQEYQDKAEGGATEAELKPLEDEITKLQQELQAAQADSEQKFAAKQQDLMAPILEKIQKAIDEIVAARGLDYVLNSATNGNSILLQAPDSDNITKDILDKLGIKIPEQE